MRGEGNEAENEKTLELAKKYLVKDGGVVGLDIAGAEALYPTTTYRFCICIRSRSTSRRNLWR
jgi:adenosine deaminase